MVCVKGSRNRRGSMVQVISRNIIYAFCAFVIISVCVPLFPTSIVIHPTAVRIDGENVLVDRNVLFPVVGHWSQEVERLTPPPPISMVECAMNGETYFERRTSPIIYKHGCDFRGPDDSQWLFRSCVQAVGLLGRKLRPACVTTIFTPNADARQQEIERTLQNLESVIRGSGP